MFRRILPLLPLLAALSAGAETYKSFWLTESISGRTVGPIVARPGNVFTVGGGQWRVLRCNGHEIVFADAEGRRTEGPYDLVEQRLLDLGPTAYVFTRIVDFTGDDPEVDRSVVTQARRAPPGDRASDRPMRWVLAPVPSTNPGAHRAPMATWSLSRFTMAPTVAGFLDLYDSVGYDWSVKSVTRRHGSDLRLMRLGASGEWNGFRAEAGLAFAGKASGALAADTLSLSRLHLRDVDGLFLSAGYDYGFVIDQGWSASVGGQLSYASLSGCVTARTARRAAAPEETAEGAPAEGAEENPTPSYEFHSWGGDLSLDEIRVTAAIGIRYDQWYWGVGAKFLLDCVGDVSTGVRVPAFDGFHDLEAERTQPVSMLFEGWYSPDDRWVILGGLSIGSETMLRVGGGWFF